MEDIERTAHGEPQWIEQEPTTRPQRPLTMEEKLASTTVDVHSRGSSSNGPSYGVAGVFAQLRELEAKMDRKLGIEAHAIERKLPEDRQPWSWQSGLSMYGIWASGTMNLSCMATGFLGKSVICMSESAHTCRS